MDSDYEKLLDNVYENLPKNTTSVERFEMPKFDYFSEGNKTIVKNFKAVADKIRREPAMLSKYLSKELAVPVEIKEERLVLQRRVVGDMLNSKLEDFVKKYVVCKECNKPDTHITDEHHIRFLVCEACGAKSTIR
ncbi:translation initiation factor IF-2 subunit beta [Candidatus Micrarchaeota archaeon]|nr:translation initiation factor IF-2 subunit beta [Candidatus Micrarchaeota archaeon]